VQALIQQIVGMAEGEKIKVKRFSRKQLSAGFLSNDNGTKHEVAVYLAARFPEELGFRLPPKRTVLMNEDCRMDMFDAVALAEHFLRSRKLAVSVKVLSQSARKASFQDSSRLPGSAA
jgi:hypothetical protein